MPIATHDRYVEMLDAAKQKGFAYPAVNVTSSQTLNAALRGFDEAQSDGIIQVSLGTALYLSGHSHPDRVTGSIALALYAHEVAKKTSVNIALHTDHCPKINLDDWVKPLLQNSSERVSRGLEPLYQSHMWDGSALHLDENLAIAAELLDKSVNARAILEIEVGVVGGEEDGISGIGSEKLYSTVEDARATVAALGAGERGRYLTALTFGNVHGVYAPGNVHLRPEILGDIQREVGSQLGNDQPFDLVFHGGSGSDPQKINEAIANGVVKMNIDTDTQYSFTRSLADHMLKNYDKVVKVDGGVGDKKYYDPRSYGASAEAAMAERVSEAAVELGSASRSIG